ncbi:MAG: hypothetical protein R6V40_02370 [Candidatus Moraniibacteriota bacterium]
MAAEATQLRLIKSNTPSPGETTSNPVEAKKKRQHSFACPACQENRFLIFYGWDNEEEEIKSEPVFIFCCRECQEFFTCNHKGVIFWRNYESRNKELIKKEEVLFLAEVKK